MATAKTISNLKAIFKTPRIGMVEVLRQVNSKNKARHFALVDGVRHQISKALYDHLGTLAERTDTIYTTQKYGCMNHYKTLMLNY